MADEEAITRTLAGETDAFAVLVHRYRDSYARFAARMVGNRADAEDVLQIAFVRAYRALDKCRDPGRFAAWCHQIVVNECRSFARRRAQRERWYSEDDAAILAIAADGPMIGEDEHRMSSGEIQRALDALPVEQREAFVLKHVEQVSYEAMSELTGMGVSALKMRVKRACQRLRELLEEVHHD
jgi:RNA polymerase sigma-70 factor (ECF subfamily)